MPVSSFTARHDPCILRLGKIASHFAPVSRLHMSAPVCGSRRGTACALCACREASLPSQRLCCQAAHLWPESLAMMGMHCGLPPDHTMQCSIVSA